MSCRRCAEVVTAALKQVPGVVKTTVDLDTGWALLTIKDYVREEDLVQALEDGGVQRAGGGDGAVGNRGSGTGTIVSPGDAS